MPKALKGVAVFSFKRLCAEARGAADYLAKNPAGFVPAPEVDGMVLGQSIAIIDFLDTLMPEPRMIPVEPPKRARALELALTIAADIHPVNNLRILQYLEHEMGQDREAVEDWYRHWIGEGFATLERLLPDTEYAGGDAPDIVDACLVPQLYNARRFRADLSAFPKTVAIGDRAAALPAFQAAAPPQLPQ